MATPSYRLAAAVTAPSTSEFLVVRQLPPPSPPSTAPGEEEYRRYVDSDLYDLPSAPLRRLAADEEPVPPGVAVGGVEDGRLDLSRFDVPAALDQVIRRQYTEIQCEA
jgi:hypothetical protein